MAIEAQHHSSNLLFFKNRIGKVEEQEQTNMGSNQRKRGRETNNQQSQFSQVLDFSLLHHHKNPPSSMVYTGLRLSSGEDQRGKSIDRNLMSGSSSSSGFQSVFKKDIVTAHIKKHNKELDEILHAQMEELRRMLADESIRHYNALLSPVEELFVKKLREKDAEIERATRFHNQLVVREEQLKDESLTWQARANWHEATAASLQAQLHEAVERRGNVQAQDSRVADEALLCAAGLEDAESAYVDPDGMRWPRRCKACRRNEATVVILPCRHLSICPECDRRALACPVCLTLRNSSVEAILS